MSLSLKGLVTAALVATIILGICWRMIPNLKGFVTLDRKVDIISLIALIISLSTAAYQIREYLRGSDLIMLEPEGITIYKFPIEPYGSYVSVVIPVSYINRGAKDTDTAILQETANISFGNFSIDLVWHQAVSVKSNSDKLEIVQDRNVTPFNVSAGSAKADLILFTPQTVECGNVSTEQKKGCDTHSNYVPWERFIQMVHAEMLKNTHDMTISVTARAFEETPQTVKCHIELVPDVLTYLNDRGYFSELCDLVENS